MSTDESTVDIETSAAETRNSPTNNNNTGIKNMENTDEEKAMKTMRPALQREYTPMPGMQLSCYKIDKKKGLVTCDLEDAIARRCEQGCDSLEPSSYWIDADVRDDYDAQELKDIIHKIKLTPFLRRHLSKPHQIKTPHALSLSSGMFLVMRVLPPEEDESNESRYVAALCVSGLLLTVVNRPGEGKAAHAMMYLNKSTRKTVEERELPEPSTSGALSLWLLLHVQRLAEIAADVRMQSYDLEEKMDTDIANVQLDDLVDLKSRVGKIVAVAEEQLECLESLKEGEAVSKTVDFSQLRGTMGIVMSTAGATDRLAGRLEKKVADLRNTYDSHQQNKINRRLEILTVLSAIFLPLTLMAGESLLNLEVATSSRVLPLYTWSYFPMHECIMILSSPHRAFIFSFNYLLAAGIWGMNFSNMPELPQKNAYYFALASMATVAASLILIFKRYGWLS